MFSFNMKASALSGTVYCPDDNEPLKIRSAANTSASIVVSVSCGEKLEILKENAGSSVGSNGIMYWHKVKYNNKEGYAYSGFITLDKSSYEKGTVICIENDDPLGIWAGVGRVGGKKASANCGEDISVISKNEGVSGGCTWYKVDYKGTVGYSCGKYISISSGSSSSSSSGGGSSNNINIGKSTTGDNIYEKKNYEDKVLGDGYISCYEDTGDLPLRSSAGGSATGNTASCGVSVKINDIKESSGNCGYYYNITNLETNKSGWVCGYYVNTTKLSDTANSYYAKTESLDDYYKSLREKGFPDSYLTYLAEIHARHPNWEFEADIINLDFDDIVVNEGYNGRNLLQGSAFNYNYRSMGLDTYNVLKDEFYDYDTEKGWYNASLEAIAFYLDPRNYLNEKYIFAFESLYYNDSHDTAMISKILSGQSFWSSVYKNYSNSVSEDLISATKKIGISSVHIASRIKQEISNINTDDPRLGGSFTYNNKSYSGYYNFFNIKVYGTNKIVNGMVYAMNNGWNTPYNGLYGGSNFIYNEYVGVNQDTMYYEKFDVSTTDGHYTHQYMQNLAAAVQETDTSYKSYVGLGNYLEKKMVFTIPVYKNMSNYAVTSPRVGNPNNYLKDLKMDGVTVSGFSYDDYEYDVTLPASARSINILANTVNSNAIVSGDGTVNIDSNKKTISVIVTAENKRSRTYKINITRLEASDEDIEDISVIMNKSGVKYNDNNIYGIGENTSINGFVNNIKNSNSLASVSIKDKNGNAKSGLFKTGDKVVVSNSRDTKEYTVVIYGDINGDAKINKDDCLAILRQLNGYANYSGAFKEAADANRDGKIDKDDCLAILRQLNGYTNLNG